MPRPRETRHAVAPLPCSPRLSRHASSLGYDEQQLAIDGQVRGRDRDPKVVGYDPDVFVSMGFADPTHSSRDAEQFDRRQPEHIALAGLLGLGRFAANEIEHRVVHMA